MHYPKLYSELYQCSTNIDPLFDLSEAQIEKPVEDISFTERISLDSRYGVCSDTMLPSESQPDDEVNDLRVRSDYDIRVSLMDQIEMRVNRDARSKAVLFNPDDYVDYSETKDISSNDTTNAND